VRPPRRPRWVCHRPRRRAGSAAGPVRATTPGASLPRGRFVRSEVDAVSDHSGQLGRLLAGSERVGGRLPAPRRGPHRPPDDHRARPIPRRPGPRSGPPGSARPRSSPPGGSNGSGSSGRPTRQKRILPSPSHPDSTGQASTTSRRPEPNLHLLGGIWIAPCPTCGFQLATARTQQRCEHHASRRTCPVCREGS
jgi:hypothetical protein